MRHLFKALILSALLAVAVPTYAQIRLDVHIGPPPPRREVIITSPDPRAIWVPGYYTYDSRIATYVWVPGSWQVPPRERVVWVQPRYGRHAEAYDYYEGHWADHHDNGKHKGWAKQAERGEGRHGGDER